VEEAIGCSLAAGSRRGDYRQAAALAESALAGAREHKSPAAEAEARFAYGVVLLLWGEPRAHTTLNVSSTCPRHRCRTDHRPRTIRAQERLHALGVSAAGAP
jgi:hypothetical protein